MRERPISRPPGAPDALGRAAPARGRGRLARGVAALGLAASFLLPLAVGAQEPAERGYAVGLQLRGGGRYDDVRLCVATGSGVKGGPTGDLAFYADFALAERWRVATTIPVFRPIVIGALSEMLQFEPQVTFERRYARDGADFLVGPSLGLSLHYGPGFESAKSGPQREPSFWAAGPIFGVYAAFDFDRAGELVNFQLGLHPYFIPLFSPESDRNGVVVGGLLDLILRFSP